MSAYGLGGSYGNRTEDDPNRGVDRDSYAQAVASRLHYGQNVRAADVEAMGPGEWSKHPLVVNRGGLVDQGQVVNVLRALENYA
jgi:hypothetical protein